VEGFWWQDAPEVAVALARKRSRNDNVIHR
jgi:hypothetical protein